MSKLDYEALAAQFRDAIEAMPKSVGNDYQKVMEGMCEMVDFLEDMHIKAICCSLGVFHIASKPEHEAMAARDFLDKCTDDFTGRLRHRVKMTVDNGLIADPYKEVTHNDKVREAILRELNDGKET